MAQSLTQRPAVTGSGLTSDRTRRRMIERLQEQGIRDERVLAALYAVPRHLFVDPALASRAYDDTALPLGHGQTISQPLIVGRMIELLLEGRAPGRVLEVGTGCGYQAAVLSRLFPEVYSVERIAALLDKARLNLRAARMVTPRLVHTDGRLGLPEAAPFDSIIVAAAAPAIPEELTNQLAANGRLVLPVGNDHEQHLWMVERTASGLRHQKLDPVKFVPLLSGRQ